MKKNLVLVLALLIAQPAQSQTQETQLLEQLQSQGFVLVEKSTSWLGRIIFDLENDTHEREVIFNPVNGSVMRDFTEVKHNSGEEDGPWYLHLFAPFRGDSDE